MNTPSLLSSPLRSARPRAVAPFCLARRRSAAVGLQVLLALALAGRAAADTPAEATKVVVTLDGRAAPPAMWATLNSRSQLVIYPYDWCAWAAQHGGASVPKDAAGSGLVFDLPSAGLSASAKFPAVYKVRSAGTKKDKKGDKNVVGSRLEACTQTLREAISGTVTLDKLTAEPDVRVSGKIDVKLVSKASGKVSRVVGKFASVDMRACQAMLPTPDLSAIPEACQPTPEAPAGIKQQ